MANNTNHMDDAIKKAKIQIIIFLILIILAVFSAFYFYHKLQKANETLIEKNILLETAKDSISALNDDIALYKDSLATKLEWLNKKYFKETNNYELSQNVDGLVQRSRKTGDYKKYDAALALALEEEAFQKIIDNDFTGAIVLFDKIDKIYPTYHMAYEIKNFLKKNKDSFGTTAGQETIKKKIVQEYSWKAPKKKLERIRGQVERDY